MEDPTFGDVRFIFDSQILDAVIGTEDLRALVSSASFSHVTAERVGQDAARTGVLPRDHDLGGAAQAIDLDGIYRFELLADGLPSGTMLTSPDEVVDLFVAWATNRPSWTDAHDWD